MRLYMTIAQMNAADLAVLLPMLKFPADTAAGKLLKAVTNVPQNQLSSFLNAFSQEAILDILSTAAADYESKILPVLGKLAKSHGFPIEITGLSINKEGRICLQIGRIDYPAIIGKYRPEILRGDIGSIADAPIMASFITMLRISLKAGLAVLSKVPPKTLGALAAGLINWNANRLLEKINGMLGEKDFSLRLGALQATE